MKSIAKSLMFSTLVSISFILFSCDVTNDEREWGIATVYMPQAVMQSGGSNNNYHVPWGTTEWDKNYSIDQTEGKDHINVVLGIYRSGLQELNEYSVDILVRPDTVDQLIDNGTFSNAVSLPDDAYTLPESMTVPDGEREAIFYLTIDRQKLLEDYPSYSDYQLVLAVGIENPSRYELNQVLSTTIVIVSNEWPSLE